MTGWLAACAILLAALVPCAITCLRGDPVDRLVGLELAGTITVLLMMALSIARSRPVFVDVALAAGVLSLGSGIVFARFLERWL